MGIWGLRSPLLPRHVPGFFSLWTSLAFSKTLSSAWLGSWIQVYLGCLAACSPSSAEMHLQSCWTAQESLPAAPWPGAEPRSVHHRNCPPPPHWPEHQGTPALHPNCSAISAQLPQTPQLCPAELSSAYPRPPKPPSSPASAFIPAEHWDVWHPTHSVLTTCSGAALFLPDTALVLLLEWLDLCNLPNLLPNHPYFRSKEHIVTHISNHKRWENCSIPPPVPDKGITPSEFQLLLLPWHEERHSHPRNAGPRQCLAAYVKWSTANSDWFNSFHQQWWITSLSIWLHITYLTLLLPSEKLSEAGFPEVLDVEKFSSENYWCLPLSVCIQSRRAGQGMFT